MTDQLTEVDMLPPKRWRSSSLGKCAQALAGALLVGCITGASTAEMILMFMLLRLQLDAYYE